MRKGPLFYAKILLFGEYGIIKDSKGLAIPYNSYQGALKYGNLELDDTAKDSNKHLRNFIAYLESIDSSIVSFDFNRLKEDLSI